MWLRADSRTDSPTYHNSRTSTHARRGEGQGAGPQSGWCEGACLPANCHAAAPAKCRFPRLRAGIDTGAGTAFGTGWAESQYKGRHGAGDVLQFEWAERLKRDVELVADVIADRLRDADAGRRTLSLEPRCHIHVAVDVSSIGDDVGIDHGDQLPTAACSSDPV